MGNLATGLSFLPSAPGQTDTGQAYNEELGETFQQTGAILAQSSYARDSRLWGQVLDAEFVFCFLFGLRSLQFSSGDSVVRFIWLWLS